MTNPADEFESAIAGDAPDTDGEPTAPLDLDQATQWVAQVDRIRRLREEYQQAHAAAVARLNARLNARVSALAEQEEWYAEALEMFHRTVLASDSEALTIPTPAGTLKSRKGQPTFSYTDDEALLAWAMENANDAVDFPPTPDPRLNKTKFKKAVKEAKVSDGVIITDDGEAVPGVTVADPERKFTIETE